MECVQVDNWVFFCPLRPAAGGVLIEPLESMVGFSNVVFLILQFEDVNVDHGFTNMLLHSNPFFLGVRTETLPFG